MGTLKKLKYLFRGQPPKWSTPEMIKSLSHDKIGVELATAVAKELKKGKQLYYAHPDYCGHGLVYKNEKYGIVFVQDGCIDYAFVIIDFDSPDEFIAYLSKQCDFSLAGAQSSVPELHVTDLFPLNNQRLSKKRLIEFCQFR